MATENLLRIGTCSWKYDSWQGLIYPQGNEINYLQEYSRHFSTVEVDQWFWSLFKGNTVVLPKTEVVREYAASVPPGFTFSIKVPNSITLTHHYNKKRSVPLDPNPHFLSTELMGKFLQTLEPLGDHIGPLMFQFEYLNKNKMASLNHFNEMFEVFLQGLPAGYQYCIEIRNPNYLKEEYFDFLADHHLGPVFLQGYYMPSIFDLYEKFKNRLSDPVVLRLHGLDRQGIEERTKNVWDKIVDPRDDELLHLRNIVNDLRERRHHVYIYVNNHYEGSAPRTIEKIKALLQLA
ncbi:DUF72 domain-containing protein [Candidatus Roizmanbacteria bacterium]|nr:DUF72 domain-containing protein [Candidatus Roizmanbacteria bacterium]